MVGAIDEAVVKGRGDEGSDTAEEEEEEQAEAEAQSEAEEPEPVSA